jgi:molecular chaperone IbpA
MGNFSLRSVDIPSIHKFSVGFESMFDELLRQTTDQNGVNYPPYNVVKHSEDKFSIELAVAGFNEGELEITVKQDQLFVRGTKNSSKNSTEIEYLYKGISSRDFNRAWTLANHIKVGNAEVRNGILTIELERIIPEEQKPRKIPITFIM